MRRIQNQSKRTATKLQNDLKPLNNLGIGLQESQDDQYRKFLTKTIRHWGSHKTLLSFIEAAAMLFLQNENRDVSSRPAFYEFLKLSSIVVCFFDFVCTLNSLKPIPSVGNCLLLYDPVRIDKALTLPCRNEKGAFVKNKDNTWKRLTRHDLDTMDKKDFEALVGKPMEGRETVFHLINWFQKMRHKSKIIDMFVEEEKKAKKKQKKNTKDLNEDAMTLHTNSQRLHTTEPESTRLRSDTNINSCQSNSEELHEEKLSVVEPNNTAKAQTKKKKKKYQKREYRAATNENDKRFCHAFHNPTLISSSFLLMNLLFLFLLPFVLYNFLCFLFEIICGCCCKYSFIGRFC